MHVVGYVGVGVDDVVADIGKPCGLMDQMACSVGGMIYIDFANKEKPVVEQVESNFEKAGLSLCIVDTKGSHADLTPDYAAVPEEMNRIAKAMGKEHLREISEEEFYAAIPRLWKETTGRSVLARFIFIRKKKEWSRALRHFVLQIMTLS